MATKKRKVTPPDEIIILQCTHCLHARDWNRSTRPEGLGYCFCRTGRFLQDIKVDQTFRVLKEHPKPGHVIVISHLGWQQLHGPHWREKPHAWRTDKIPV